MARKVLAWLSFSFFLLSGTILHGADVPVKWTENLESNLAGYRLYRGIKSRVYGPPVGTVIGRTPGYTYTDLVIGEVYYLAVTAFNTAGNESAFSNEISVVSMGAANTAGYAPGNVRVFIQQDLPDTLGFAWNRNPGDQGYRLYVYYSLSGSPVVMDVGDVTFKSLPTNGSHFMMVEVVGYRSDSIPGYVSNTAEWLAGNVTGDYRTGIAPDNIRVSFEDMGVFTQFGDAVTHCVTPSSATSSDCPPPTDIQLMDRDGDGVFGPFDLILWSLYWNLTPPL